MTISEFVKNANETIFDDIGVDLYSCMGNLCLADLDEWRIIDTVRINPKMCGPLAPMFATVNVRVSVGMDVAFGFVRYEYSYTHTDDSYTHTDSGTNGYTVIRKFNV